MAKAVTVTTQQSLNFEQQESQSTPKIVALESRSWTIVTDHAANWLP